MQEFNEISNEEFKQIKELLSQLKEERKAVELAEKEALEARILKVETALSEISGKVSAIESLSAKFDDLSKAFDAFKVELAKKPEPKPEDEKKKKEEEEMAKDDVKAGVKVTESAPKEALSQNLTGRDLDKAFLEMLIANPRGNKK